MNVFIRITAPVALLALAACATDTQRPADDAAADSGAATTTPYSGPAAGSADVTSAAASMPDVRTIHFAFDSSEISGDGQALADGWAAYLAANPSARVRLEGHADERGTREYNVGLGERRGNAVLQALTSRGASARQLSVTSYGEERPVAMGHDESAWQQNRRVEIVP
ncbi:MAG: peptidoglycan-associated lipoprotein Pal [Nevskiaceae bacterium]